MLNHWGRFTQDWNGDIIIFKDISFGAHTNPASIQVLYFQLFMPVWMRWVLPALRTEPSGDLQSWPQPGLALQAIVISPCPTL